MTDDARRYADEEAYGDDGPAYGDHGPIGGRAAAARPAPSFDDDAAYGDHGPLNGGGRMARPDASEGGYQPPAYDAPSYRDDVDDHGEADPDGLDPALELDDEAPLLKPRKAAGRSVRLAAGAVAALVVLGGGAFLLLGSTDPFAPLRSVPVIGALLGGPAPEPAQATPAKPHETSFFDAIPFFSHHDSTLELAALMDNVVAVQRAVEAATAEHHKLPSTLSAIESQMAMNRNGMKNPYGGTVKLVLGEVPGAPGAIAYLPHKDTFELRVGGHDGGSLRVNGVELVIEGQAGDAVAADPAPEASPDTAASSSQKVALLPKATPSSKPVPGDASGGWKPHSGKPPGDKPPTHTPAPLPSLPSDPLTPESLGSVRERLGHRNQDFDKLRIQAMVLVYGKKTDEALVVFKKAQAIHPDDEGVAQWVRLIQAAHDKRDGDYKAKHKEDHVAAQRTGSGSSRWSRTAPEPPRVERLPDPPRPIATPRPPADDSNSMLEELKKADKLPLLAPPKLDP